MLLRRAAALAAGTYVAPALTSLARASGERTCKGTCASGKRCRKRGGEGCKCIQGRCRPAGCRCTRQNPGPCDALEPCPGEDCFCFQDSVKGGLNGVCIDLGDGFCSSFELCVDGQCPAGQVCFDSCCPGPPLCADCCGSRSTAPARGGVTRSQAALN